MALLKLYRGLAAPAAEVGKIWFDVTNGVIKVYNGTEWEAYGLSEAEIAALILAAKNEVLGTLEEGDSTTLAALNDEIDALQAELAALAAKTVTINEKTTGHVTVSKTVDAQGAAVYTVAENDIASAKGLADEIKRATDEEARIAGLVATEQGRATAAEEALAGRLDVIEGEGEGSIKKALADAKAYTDEAKAAVIGDATEAGNTLGKLEDRIETIVANEKTYSIAKVTEGLGENVKEAYKLVDEDGTQAGETINIYKDSSLISVDLVDADASGKAGQYIKYVYVLANGTESVQYVDVSRLLVEAEFKNGLEVSQAGEINVKVDAASEAFLTVGADGVKLSGVQHAITTAKNEAIAEIAPAIEALDAEVTSTDGAKVTVKVTEVDGKITAVNVTESDIASAEALATLDAEVQEHEQVVSAALNDLNARIEDVAGDVADLTETVNGLDFGVTSLEVRTNSDHVSIIQPSNTGDVNVSVEVTSVDAKDGGAKGLATDAYVREQIAAAAMVWEEGSF